MHSAPRLRLLVAMMALVSLNGCFLLEGISGGGDAPPLDTRLLVSDGERLLWLGPGGLDPATEPFPIALSLENLATSVDRSRVVIAGVDTDTGDHGVWMLQRGGYERIAVDVTRTKVGRDARWVWTEGSTVGAALHHHDGGGVPVMSSEAGDLELLLIAPRGAFAIMKQGTMLHLVYPPGDEEQADVSFDPGMGADWSFAALRPNGLLLEPGGDTPGTWFSLVGEEAGSEDTVPRLGYTLRDGELTWRTASATVNVAAGLPDDIGDILASDFGVVLARQGEVLTYFDYAGVVLGTYEPEAIPEEPGGELPISSTLVTLVPKGVRGGVFVVEYTTAPNEADEAGRTYATVHAYHLDAANTLEVSMVSAGTVSRAPGHFGHHESSDFVAWVEGTNLVAYHDMGAGRTERVEVERAMHFEAQLAPAHRHY